MRTFITTLLALVFAAVPCAAQESALRLKDVTTIQGSGPAPLIGYGLIVGLNKTGDRRQTVFSAQTLANMLERFGVAVRAGEIKIENVAAVLVTTEQPSYASVGARLDVTVSSIGDARSLQGGVLLPTALRGPDGQVRALAQGPISLGGYSAGTASNNVQVNHLTVGRVPGGGLVQVAPAAAPASSDQLSFVLRDADFTSADHVAQAIVRELGPNSAHVTDAATIVVTVPGEYRRSVPELIARLAPLRVDLDTIARVVINERTGTVVVGGAVRIGPAAVAHGNLSVKIQTRLEVSQPLPMSNGQTTVVPQEKVDTDEGSAQLMAIGESTTLDAVVQSLNALGATPRDMIAILQALKAAGALRAEIVIL